MNVQLYKGSIKLVKNSGVGRALQHQEEMLQMILPEVSLNAVQNRHHTKKPDRFIHINTVFPDSLLAALLAKALGRKVIYYGHSTEEDFKNSFKFSDRLAPLFRKWIKLCYSSGDAIITPTEYSRQLLLSYGIHRPVYALSNGVDTEFFHPSSELRRAFRARYLLDPNEKVVLSAGHYIARKGILEYIELARSMPNIQFFWFGHTNPHLIPQEIQDAIKNAPMNLFFPGYVSREELREAYCGCDLFCFMSKEETEGIVVLEALACGIPTIVRDIPVYEGWLKDGRNVYKGTDLASFHEKASRILREEAVDLTPAGRQTAEERSIRKMGQKLLHIYHQVSEKEPEPQISERKPEYQSC